MFILQKQTAEQLDLARGRVWPEQQTLTSPKISEGHLDRLSFFLDGKIGDECFWER